MSKMTGMTTQERLEDISRRSGLSIDICRRVLNAETESCIETLKKGERTNLGGRVTLRPELRHKVGIGENITTFIKVKAEISSSLASVLEKYDKFEVSEEPEEGKQEFANGIRLRQIQSLL